MPCYHPIQAHRFKYRSGNYSAPMFSLPADLPRYLAAGIKLEQIALPCNNCIGCRLEKSREWAVRCVYESSLYKENSFITLTYSDEHLPENRSLVRKDLQDFFKRLRIAVNRKLKKKGLPAKKIRYYACGEYGEQTERPHYHAILFNHQFDDLKEITKLSEHGLSRFKHSQFLSDVWGKGIVSVGDMTFESAAYVARYCLKKINGPAAESHYNGRVPEFSAMSLKPGIAKTWWDKYKDDVINNDCTFSRGRPAPVPRYFDKCLEKIDAELLKSIKDLRASKIKDPYDFTFESFLKLRQKEDFKKSSQKKISRSGDFFEKND